MWTQRKVLSLLASIRFLSGRPLNQTSSGKQKISDSESPLKTAPHESKLSQISKLNPSSLSTPFPKPWTRSTSDPSSTLTRATQSSNSSSPPISSESNVASTARGPLEAPTSTPRSPTRSASMRSVSCTRAGLGRISMLGSRAEGLGI